MGSDVLPANSGTVLGRYRLLEPAGTGGTARVWRGRDLQVGVDVAVKIFEPGSAAAEAAAREAWAAQRLAHPGLPPLLDRGRADGRQCLVWEHIDGVSASELAAAGAQLDDASIARIGVQLASALCHAHGRGISHGDVKPANVLLDRDGTALLIDFGACGKDGPAGEARDVAGAAAVAAALADPRRLASPILRSLVEAAQGSGVCTARQFGQNMVSAARLSGIDPARLGYAAASPVGQRPRVRGGRVRGPRRRGAEGR
jgi:serine/threonine protein kinase